MTASVLAIGPGSSWERVREALEGRGLVARLRGDRHADARCPAHDDGRASLTADYQDGEPGRVLLCCHAGCEFADIVTALGLRESDTFDGPPRRDRAAVRPRQPRSARAVRQAEPPSPAKCARHRWSEVESYTYTDRGEVVMQVVRKTCEACGAKNFPVRRPDGRGGWAWQWPEHRPLYRLDEVREAVAAGRTVYVAEGEKDVHALEAAGEVATCNPGGAGKWRPAHSAALAGAARVVIVADRDKPGYKHAAAVRDGLAGSRTAVEVVEAAEGKDAADHLGAGRTAGEFVSVDPAARLAELDRGAEVAEISSRRRGGGNGGGGWNDDEDQGDDDGGEPEPPVGAEPVEGSPGWVQVPPSGDYPGSVLQLTGAGKRRSWTPVLWWSPDTAARLVTAADNGQATGRYFEVRVGEDTQIVSHADLRSGEAWDKFPDASGVGAKKVREVLDNVVTGHARSLPRTLAAVRTGWHEQDGSRFYLHPDGRTFPDGRRVRLIGAPVKLALAAQPLDSTATTDEIRRALEDIRDHGRAPALFTLGAGARSLAQSLVPVRAALALVGRQNAGKSSAAAHGRGLLLTRQPDPFPFIPTKNFGATRTDLEFAVNFEADMPQIIEDLALSGDAPAAEIREAVGKLEALIRPVANDDEIRGRRTRDLLPAPANYVRSIPAATAQALPAGMQSSLYRRAVVLYLRDGDVDTMWYAPAHLGGSGGGRLLAVPLRTLGDRLIARLYEHGDDLERVLNGYAAEAYRMLSPAMDAALPGWVGLGDGTTGIVRSAAGMLAGLAMVAEVTEGAEFAELAVPVLGPLAGSLAEQASKMADRAAAADSLADAVARVLTAALLNRRAHICGRDGRAAPLVPGLTLSQQGLRDTGGQFAPDYEGFGVPLYWLPDRGGVGVRSEDLHALMVQSGDSRAAGLTPRSLPDALLKDGASIRNETQEGRVAAHRIRVGASDEPKRLILLRQEIITGDDDETPYRVISANGNNGNNGNAAGQEPVNDLGSGNAEKNGNNAGQGQDEVIAPAAPAAPAAPLTSDVAVVPVVPAGTGTRAAFVTGSDRFAAPAVVADVDGGYLARPDRVEGVELPSPLRDLADAAGWAVTLRLGVAHEGGMPDDPVIVILPELAARLGLPASPPDPPGTLKPSKAAREHPALAPLRASGWNIDTLRSWMRAWKPGGRTVRIWLPGWDEYGTCPMWGDGVPALTLAWRLGEFAELLGIGWRLNGGMTGIDLSKTFKRRSLRLEAVEPPKPAFAPLEAEISWSRKPESGEAALGWLHCYDGNGAYTSAYNTPVNVGGWRHAEAPAFDPKLPGYWLAELPASANRMLPDPADPTGRDERAGRRGGPLWRATPTLAGLAELGYEIAPLEAWLPSDGYGRYWEPWYERVRDARAVLAGSADDDGLAVLDAFRSVWHATHGAITIASQGKRRDHDHTIIAAYRANLLRRAVKIGDREARWPLAIATDNMAYASADPDPRSACPAGLTLGTGLGQFKHSGTLPMSDAVPLLGTGRSGDVTRLFEAAAEWREAQHGA